MKPIYKSLALAAMTLQVSVALQAQVNDGTATSQIDVLTEVLDSLRVELVAPNVFGARDLIKSGECTLSDNDLLISLNTAEWLKGGVYRLQVSATFGTQTQVIYALGVNVPRYDALASEPQEYEDTVTVVSTIADIIGSDLEGLALEATSQEIKSAITPISQAAEAYNTGKTELAQNITAKGIEASASETLPELAEKVAQIAQETTIYEGADSYGKQIGAGGSLWDLYQVLADMKTRFIGTGDYAALVVCEYYKGYDSLVLQGADGYYTCDGDYYDYASQNHVWHDEDNGKMNRWVAFLYLNEGARLDITNTGISPRSMYIGGHIGTIEYFVNGRLTDLVCGIEDTDVLDNFAQKSFTQPFSQNAILRNVKNYDRILIGNVVNFCLDTTSLKTDNYSNVPLNVGAQYVHIKQTRNITVPSATGYCALACANAIGVAIEGGSVKTNINYGSFFAPGASMPNARYIHINGFVGGTLFPSGFSQFSTGNLEDLLIGSAQQNINAALWNPSSVLADAVRKARLVENIKNHIIARVSDRTGLSQLTFTISTNMYNNIASEQIEWQGETMSLADAFLTKNWLLAGA